MAADEIDLKVEDHFKLMYAANVQMRAQQTRGRIRAAVTEFSASGEAMSVADLVGTVDAVRIGGRDRRNMDNRPTNDRRWVVFREKLKSGQYIDTEDKLRMVMDPTSTLVRTHTNAVVREVDDVALGVVKEGGAFVVGEGGVLGTATEGKRPGSSGTPLPAKCYTEAGGAGLTLPKLRASKLRLNKDEFGLEDDMELNCAITPQQVDDLLAIAEASSLNLNAFQIDQLSTGKPTSLLGFTWIVTNRLPFDKDGNRMCPIWAKSNVIMGVWQDVRGRVWNDTASDNTPYAVVDARVDAVRAEDEGVQVILCAEPANG